MRPRYIVLDHDTYAQVWDTREQRAVSKHDVIAEAYAEATRRNGKKERNMTGVDTSAATVERLAHHAHKLLMGTTLDPLVAATLRALVAERDAAQQQANEGRQAEVDADTERQAAEADRDRLAARVAELEGALRDLMTWFPDKPSQPEWRLPGGNYGADEAVGAARAALAGSKPDDQ